MPHLKLLFLSLLWGFAANVLALETVSLQFKWSHAFQFAGYYAALEKGYYREAGLEVILREGGPGSDPLEAVLSGKAQYGVGTSSLLLARQAGRPAVVLAVVFQHSPLVLIARRDSDNPSIHDIVGKRVMIEPQSDELIAYLKQEGIAADRLVQVPHSADPQDLIAGRVDAISAYVSNETFYLDAAGIPYQTYTPRMGGIDFYGDNLFTTEQELKNHPQRARAFRAASLRGWQYAMAHPEEIVDLILARYSQQHPREFYLSEARHMVPLLRTDLIDVGYMTRGRWRHIADTYASLGLLPAGFDLDGFLYEPDKPAATPHAFYLSLAVIAAIAAIAAAFLSQRRRLTAALVAVQQATAQVNQLALRDPATGLPARCLLHDRLACLLARLRRDSGHGALLILSLPEPDTQWLGALKAIVREVDSVGHLDARKVVLLLGDLARDEQQARVEAERVLARIVEKVQASVPAPAGAIVMCDGDAAAEELLRAADSAVR